MDLSNISGVLGSSTQAFVVLSSAYDVEED